MSSYALAGAVDPGQEASTGNCTFNIEWGAKALQLFPAISRGIVEQQDAQTQSTSQNKLISTDPPYYDNIGYADLSDFFYI